MTSNFHRYCFSKGPRHHSYSQTQIKWNEIIIHQQGRDQLSQPANLALVIQVCYAFHAGSAGKKG